MARLGPLLAVMLVFAACPVAASADEHDASNTTRVDAGRTGFLGGGSLGRPPLTERWRAAVDDVLSVVAADGLVFVSAGGFAVPATVVAYDAADGSERWRRPLASSSTLAVADGRLVVLGADGALLAIDAATGRVLWTRSVEGRIWQLTSPVIDDGIVFGAASSYALYAFDLRDGRLVWRRAIVIEDEPAVAGGQVLVGQSCGGYALEPTTGDPLWTRTSLCTTGQRSIEPASDGGRLITGFHGILDASGGRPIDSYRDASEKHAPALVGDTLLRQDDGKLTARSLSAKVIRWSATTPGAFSGPPLVVDAVVYQGTASGEVEARDLETGQWLWTAPRAEDDPAAVRSLIAAGGRLYVASGDSLVAFAAAAPSPADGLRIRGGPDGPTRLRRATFAFDGPGGLPQTCSLDGGSAKPCAGAVSFEELEDGPHTLVVRSVGPDGTTVGLAARGFTVDTTGPPTFFAFDHREGLYNTADFEASAHTDEERFAECRLDDGPWRACALATFHDVPDGAHTLGARGADALGNVGPVTTKTVVVDTTAPEIVVTSAPPSVSRSRDAEIRFEGPSDLGSAVCRDERRGTIINPCESPIRLTDLDEGEQEVVINGQDRAGHVSNEVVVHWRVDTTATSDPSPTPTPTPTSSPTPTPSPTSTPTSSPTPTPSPTSTPPSGPSPSPVGSPAPVDEPLEGPEVRDDSEAPARPTPTIADDALSDDGTATAASPVAPLVVWPSSLPVFSPTAAPRGSSPRHATTTTAVRRLTESLARQLRARSASPAAGRVRGRFAGSRAS